jgi:hypothetical protein
MIWIFVLRGCFSDAEWDLLRNRPDFQHELRRATSLEEVERLSLLGRKLIAKARNEDCPEDSPHQKT